MRRRLGLLRGTLQRAQLLVLVLLAAAGAAGRAGGATPGHETPPGSVTAGPRPSPLTPPTPPPPLSPTPRAEAPNPPQPSPKQPSPQQPNPPRPGPQAALPLEPGPQRQRGDNSPPRRERAGPPAEAAFDDFGRWERRVVTCRIQHQGEPTAATTDSNARSCTQVRLDQQLAGLLTVRFLQSPRDPRTMGQQLVVAGVLSGASQPMQCRDGSCQPSWPVQLEVSALAHAEVDSRGISLSLPRAELAQGSCRLESRLFRCTLRNTTTREQWTLESEL